MSDDKTRQDGDGLPEIDPVADGEVVDELEDRFDKDSSEDGVEDADLEDGADKGESRKAGKKTSKVVVHETAKVPVKKTAATRECSETERGEHDPYRTENPAQFVRQSVAEPKEIVWPSWGGLTALFSAVLLFVLFIIAYVMLLGNGFGWALLSLLGGNPQ